MCGREATQRVSATILTVRRHGADDGVEILLLLQTGGVGLRGHCTERHMLAWLQGHTVAVVEKKASLYVCKESARLASGLTN